MSIGLLTVAASLLVLSRATTTSGYPLVAVVLVLLGVGMALAMAPATDSIMGSLPREKAGVGSAVNDTTREVGGALGVAILGSITAASYTAAMAGDTVVQSIAAAGPQGAAAAEAVKKSIGGASIVADQLGGLEKAGKVPAGATQALIDASNAAFVQAMDHTVIVAAVIAGLGALVALLWLPARPAAARSVEELGDAGELAVRGAQDFQGNVARKRDVLGVTLRILTEAGFSSLNFHGVASRAGIATGTIERNWNSKLDLVIDALRDAVRRVPDPRHGIAARGLLTSTCVRPRRALRIPRHVPVIAGLVGDSARDDELDDALPAAAHRTAPSGARSRWSTARSHAASSTRTSTARCSSTPSSDRSTTVS